MSEIHIDNLNFAAIKDIDKEFLSTLTLNKLKLLQTQINDYQVKETLVLLQRENQQDINKKKILEPEKVHKTKLLMQEELNREVLSLKNELEDARKLELTRKLKNEKDKDQVFEKIVENTIEILKYLLCESQDTSYEIPIEYSFFIPQSFRKYKDVNTIRVQLDTSTRGICKKYLKDRSFFEYDDRRYTSVNLQNDDYKETFKNIFDYPYVDIIINDHTTLNEIIEIVKKQYNINLALTKHFSHEVSLQMINNYGDLSSISEPIKEIAQKQGVTEKFELVLFRKKNRKDFLYQHEIEEVCSNVLRMDDTSAVLQNQLFNISSKVSDIQIDNIDTSGNIINHFDIKTCKQSTDLEQEKNKILKILPGLRDYENDQQNHLPDLKTHQSNLISQMNFKSSQYHPVGIIVILVQLSIAAYIYLFLINTYVFPYSDTIKDLTKIVQNINRISDPSIKDYQNDDIVVGKAEDIRDLKTFLKQYYLNQLTNFSQNQGLTHINKPRVMIQRMKKTSCKQQNMQSDSRNNQDSIIEDAIRHPGSHSFCENNKPQSYNEVINHIWKFPEISLKTCQNDTGTLDCETVWVPKADDSTVIDSGYKFCSKDNNNEHCLPPINQLNPTQGMQQQEEVHEDQTNPQTINCVDVGNQLTDNSEELDTINYLKNKVYANSSSSSIQYSPDSCEQLQYDSMETCIFNQDIQHNPCVQSPKTQQTRFSKFWDNATYSSDLKDYILSEGFKNNWQSWDRFNNNQSQFDSSHSFNPLVRFVDTKHTLKDSQVVGYELTFPFNNEYLETDSEMMILGNADYKTNTDYTANTNISSKLNTFDTFSDKTNNDLFIENHLNKALNFLIDFNNIIVNNQLPQAKCIDETQNLFFKLKSSDLSKIYQSSNECYIDMKVSAENSSGVMKTIDGIQFKSYLNQSSYDSTTGVSSDQQKSNTEDIFSYINNVNSESQFIHNKTSQFVKLQFNFESIDDQHIQGNLEYNTFIVQSDQVQGTFALMINIITIFNVLQQMVFVYRVFNRPQEKQIIKKYSLWRDQFKRLDGQPSDWPEPDPQEETIMFAFKQEFFKTVQCVITQDQFSPMILLDTFNLTQVCLFNYNFYSWLDIDESTILSGAQNIHINNLNILDNEKLQNACQFWNNFQIQFLFSCIISLIRLLTQQALLSDELTGQQQVNKKVLARIILVVTIDLFTKGVLALIDYIYYSPTTRIDSYLQIFYQYLSPGMSSSVGQKQEFYLFTYWVSILDLFISAILVSEQCMGQVWQLFNMQQLRNSKDSSGKKIWEFFQVSLPESLANYIDGQLGQIFGDEMRINKDINDNNEDKG